MTFVRTRAALCAWTTPCVAMRRALRRSRSPARLRAWLKRTVDRREPLLAIDGMASLRRDVDDVWRYFDTMALQDPVDLFELRIRVALQRLHLGWPSIGSSVLVVDRALVEPDVGCWCITSE